MVPPSYLNICSPWNAAIMKQCDVRTSGRDGQLVAALHPGVVDSVSGVKQVKAENCVGPVLILTVQCGVWSVGGAGATCPGWKLVVASTGSGHQEPRSHGSLQLS